MQGEPAELRGLPQEPLLQEQPLREFLPGQFQQVRLLQEPLLQAPSVQEPVLQPEEPAVQEEPAELRGLPQEPLLQEQPLQELSLPLPVLVPVLLLPEQFRQVLPLQESLLQALSVQGLASQP